MGLGWLVLVATLPLALQPMGFVIVLLALMSGVRVVFHHPSFLALLLDAGVVALGCAFAWWAAHTAPALAIWSFFLVQTFVVWMPNRAGLAKHSNFDDAQRDAVKALRGLANQGV